jgi:hypothetical protein
MSEVRFERAGAVGRLVLDRPPQNRMGKQLVLDLTQAIHEAATSDIRVLLLRGAGPDFFDNVGGEQLALTLPLRRPHGRVVRCVRIGSLGPRPTTAESRSTSDVPSPIGCPCRGASSSITSPAGRRSPRSRGSAGTSRADAKSRPTPWAALEEAFAEDERAQAHGEPRWLPSDSQRRPGRTGVLPRATRDRFLPPTGSRGDLTDHRHRPLHPRRGDVRTRCPISVRSNRGIEVTARISATSKAGGAARARFHKHLP